MHMLLSTKRSGSTFLIKKINELENPFDDMGFQPSADRDVDFGLYRNHLYCHEHVLARVLGFYETIAKRAQSATTFIFHRRKDLKLQALSDIIRLHRRMRTEEDFRNFNNWEHVRTKYNELRFYLPILERWIQENIPSNIVYRTYYEDLATDMNGFLDHLCWITKQELTYSDLEFRGADYNLIPNLQEHLNAL